MTTTTPAAWTIRTLATALGIRPADITGGHPVRALTETESARIIRENALQVTANVIGGYLTLDTSDLDEDDDRWLIADCPVTRCRVERITVGAWGVDEDGMERAERGLSSEGLSRVTEWVEDGADTWTTWVVRRTDREVRGWVPTRAYATLVLSAPGQTWVRRGAPEGSAKSGRDLDELHAAMRVVVERGLAVADLPSRGWYAAPITADPWAGTRLAAVRALMPGVTL
jgi:hypothetical protein